LDIRGDNKLGKNTGIKYFSTLKRANTDYRISRKILTLEGGQCIKAANPTGQLKIYSTMRISRMCMILLIILVRKIQAIVNHSHKIS